MYLPVYACLFIRFCMHENIECMYAYVFVSFFFLFTHSERMYVCASDRARKFVDACVCACLCAFVRAHVLVCILVCACVREYTYMFYVCLSVCECVYMCTRMSSMGKSILV